MFDIEKSSVIIDNFINKLKIQYRENKWKPIECARILIMSNQFFQLINDNYGVKILHLQPNQVNLTKEQFNIIATDILESYLFLEKFKDEVKQKDMVLNQITAIEIVLVFLYCFYIENNTQYKILIQIIWGKLLNHQKSVYDALKEYMDWGSVSHINIFPLTHAGDVKDMRKIYKESLFTPVFLRKNNNSDE